ncbi:hypothetical protein HQ529_01255, partial [Candidatus Woesearchaeota archaeon]|nr:hypothetical protein [Candidatus Woesearchaeota archaeon]
MPNYESFEIDRERFDEFLKEAKDTLKLNKPISKKLEELVKNGVKLRKILGEYISAKEKEEKEVKKEGEDIKKIGVESDKIKKQIEEVVGKEIQSIEEAEKEINSLNEQEKILEKIYKIHTRESKQISIKGTGKKAVSNKIFFKRGIGFLNSISNIGKRIANNGEVEISELILDFKEFNKLMKFINNNLNLKFKAENKEELEKHQQLVDIQKGVEQLGKELFKKDKETEDEEDEIDKETGQIRILFNKALNEVGEEPVIIPEEVPEPEKTIVPKEDGSATNKLLELLKNSSDEETESDDKEDFNHTIVIKLGDEKDIELIVKNSKDETFDVEYVSFIDDDRATYNFKAPIDDKYYVYRKDNKKL